MTEPQRPRPPLAVRRPEASALHGETRTDDYRWLQDRESPEVIAHLEAENAHADAWFAPHALLADRLYGEILSRIQQTDLSVPYRRGAHFYYSRTEEGRQYPILCRRANLEDAPEQVLLDLNAMAEGHAFFAVGDFEMSPDEAWMAWTTDTTGYRQYTLHVRELATGRTLEALAERVTSVAWGTGERVLWYTQEDPQSKRSHRLYRHPLGSTVHDLVHEEADERFNVSVALTRSERWLVHSRSSHTTSEVAVLRSDQPGAAWRLIAPRRQDIEYDVDHRGDTFWIRVNDTGREFRLVAAPESTPGPDHWREVIPHRSDVTLAGIDAFARFLVLFERTRALPRLSLLDPDSGVTRIVPFEEEAYSVSPSANAHYDAAVYRYAYQSFLTPPSVHELDAGTLVSRLLKRTEVPGGWDPANYRMHREWLPARDGTAIPVTILTRADHVRDATAPALLVGYGAYGHAQHVGFGAGRFSLVDRGMVYAIAHVRGGGDLGQAWHDAGRMQHKMNTFTDFIDVARGLARERWVRPGGVIGHGGSAGGLLIGAVANLDPEPFAALFALVPFVDVLNTMLDPTLPLTVGEFEEWGDPRIPEQYAWMRAYSPYDNVAARAYPPMLVRTSLNDSQVMYWEPAKWVARLRERRTDDASLLLRCDMGSGHGGASGRYDAIRETAEDFAWMLVTLGLEGGGPTP